jgi:hypothetical protein
MDCGKWSSDQGVNSRERELLGWTALVIEAGKPCHEPALLILAERQAVKTRYSQLLRFASFTSAKNSMRLVN